MNPAPMFGDVDAFGDPHTVVSLHMIEKPFERDRPRRPAHQPAVQAHRQHLRAARLPLGVQTVECVPQMRENCSPLGNPAGEENRMSLVSRV